MRFFKKKKIINLNFKYKLRKKKFYQRLLFIKEFINYKTKTKKLLKWNFKFWLMIQYLRIWASWFTCTFSYKRILFLLRYSYFNCSRKIYKFKKLFNAKNNFLNFRIFKTKNYYLLLTVFKVNSYFLKTKRQINEPLYDKIFLLLSCLFFFKYFLKVYFIFNFFWWYTKCCINNFFSMITYSNWFLKKITISYFGEKNLILNIENNKELFRNEKPPKPLKLNECKIFFYCHTFLLLR